MKDKEFILHICGLILLTGLAVFFAIIESRTGKEITDIGLITGGLLSIITHSAVSRNKKPGE